MMERRRALGGSIPKRIIRPRRPFALPLDTTFEELRNGSGEQSVSTTMGFTRLLRNLVPRREHRPVRRADHPRRRPHVRHGLAVPRAEDLRVAGSEVRAGGPRPAAQLRRVGEGPDPRGRHHRGRLDGQLHRRRHGLRHPRRTDDPVLHVLFDVRFPACRRPHLAGGRRPHPRLPDGRHGRSHHAARRRACSTRTATRWCWPARCRRARRTTRRSRTRWPPSCRPASTGCTRRRAPTPTSSTTSRSTTRTTRCRRCPKGLDPADIVRGLYRWAAGRRRTAERRRHGAVQRLGATARPAPPRRSCSSSYGVRRGAVVGHVVQGAARARRSPPSAGTACTRTSRRARRWSPSCSARRQGPIVAVTDFMKIVPEQVARFVPGRTFVPLGTDGMGRSDTREALRRLLRGRRRATSWSRCSAR